MKPSRHIIASLFAGTTVAFFIKDYFAGIICFIFGVFIDIDHVIEFFIHRGFSCLNIKKIYDFFSIANNERRQPFEKLYLLFHCNEIAILLWVIMIYTNNYYIMAMSVGYTLHLIMDTKTGSVPAMFYFFLWRMLRGFEVKNFFEKNLNIGKR
ncbi:MAG: hypothetical protein HY810_07355 [Candidatus Omnitrophica bacterium]|nr:hypothetical protein [Candidatus Omnitrophota bacterium]